MKHFIKASIYLLISVQCYALENIQVERLDVLNKTWNSAKAYHSGACETNWDNALLAAIPQVVEAQNLDQFNQAINSMLDLLGENQTSNSQIITTPELAKQVNDLSWLDSDELSSQSKERIQIFIDEFRPRTNCFVTEAFPRGNGDFSNDEQYFEVDQPGAAMKLLALFKFWGIYNYYSPYKHLLEDKWSSTVKKYIDSVYSAISIVDFHKAMNLFIAETKDTHGFYSNFELNTFLLETSRIGIHYFPFVIKTVEGKAIIFSNISAIPGINLGDEVISIDGRLISDIRERIKNFMVYSHPAAMIRKMDFVLNSGEGTSLVKLKNSANEPYEINLEYTEDLPIVGSIDQPKWASMDQDTCTIGYAGLGKLAPEEIDTMMSEFDNKDAIIFDVREYPRGVIWQLVNYLYRGPITIARFANPILRSPGAFGYIPNVIGQGRSNPYSGRVIILMNEETQSQGEFTVMGLEQFANSVKIGSQTAAADGNVSFIRLPGNIVTDITGLGVFYKDNTSTQRVGIVPDLFVKPTISNVRNGIDDVLTAALDCDNIRNLNWPNAPGPKSALFWDPQNPGTGIDIAEVNTNFTIIPYDYREDGTPVWYLGVAQAEAGKLKLLPNSMREFNYTNNNEISSELLDTSMTFDFKRGPQEIQCAKAFQELVSYPSQLQWRIKDETTTLCEEEFIFANDGPEIDFTGLWWGGETQSGWGVSINTQGNKMVTIVYFYDENGKAIWLLGTSDFNNEAPFNIDLRKFNFCKECTENQSTSEIVATLTLSLVSATSEFNASNWLSLEFGDSIWNRQEMPIKLFSLVQ